ncbi:MAG: hypothetical protein AB7E55_16750 [Pigmentiphaga sp.]
MADSSYGYRTACTVDRNDGKTCQFCRESKVREYSGRLECPMQGGYQVGKFSVCDQWKGLA